MTKEPENSAGGVRATGLRLVRFVLVGRVGGYRLLGLLGLAALLIVSALWTRSCIRDWSSESAVEAYRESAAETERRVQELQTEIDQSKGREQASQERVAALERQAAEQDLEIEELRRDRDYTRTKVEGSRRRVAEARSGRAPRLGSDAERERELERLYSERP